jgi:hypothetical protein
MIVSDLPPSRILGSLATSIHTVAFNCFISTARTGLFSSRWSTMIFDGDPGVDRGLKRLASVVYRTGLSKGQVRAAHQELSARADDAGQRGVRLDRAVVPILNDFVERGIVERGEPH